MPSFYKLILVTSLIGAFVIAGNPVVNANNRSATSPASTGYSALKLFLEDEQYLTAIRRTKMVISFSGITTFKTADALREVAMNVPDDKLLIETDSPYLAPIPHRGKQNWPALVKHVAETLAEVRGTSVEHIAKISKENYYRLFSNN